MNKFYKKLLTVDCLYKKIGINFFSRYRFGKLTKFYNKDSELKELKKGSDFIKSLKGKYKGKRCFIIGNGPSLNEQDLTLLKNEFTIGSNYIYKNYEKMGFVPTIFTIVNYLVAEQRIDEVNKLEGTVKIFPYFLNYCIESSANTFFLNSPAIKEFSYDVDDYISWQSTVTFFNMQIARYLGFDVVYLIGVDNNYTQPDTGKEGAMIEQNEDDQNHFSKEYFKGLTWQKADTDAMEYVYFLSAEAYSKSSQSLINATHGGRLEVFERVKYETLFSDFTKSVDSPLDELKLSIDKLKPKGGTVVVSVNPDLKDKFGHYLHYDSCVKKFLPFDVDFISLSKKTLDEDLSKKYKWMMPVFSDHTWTIGRDSCKSNFVSNDRFKYELAHSISIINELYDDVILYFYTGSFAHLEQMLDMVNKYEIKNNIHLNLFWEHFNVESIRENPPLELLDQLSKCPNIFLYVDSNELNKVLFPYIDTMLPLWVMFPITDFSLPVRTKKDTDKLTIIFPGNLRIEKGYDLTLKLIKKMLKMSDTCRFMVRTGLQNTLENDVIDLKGELSRNVEFVDGILTESEYVDFIRNADIVVLPYRVDEFCTRTSGVMADMIVLEKPVVAAKGTWMGNIIEESGNGEVFEDGNVEDIYNKLLLIISDYDKYKVSSCNLKESWQQQFNVRTFQENILGISG